jgi:hypothetical protein
MIVIQVLHKLIDTFFSLWYHIKSSKFKYAGMAELADVQDLGSCGVIRAGSSPVTRTK